MNDNLVASRRSLASSVNDLLASISSSEMNEKVSEEKGKSPKLVRFPIYKLIAILVVIISAHYK